MRLYRYCFYIVFLAFPYLSGGAEAASAHSSVPAEKKVAVLYSTHGIGGWNIDLDNALRKVFSGYTGLVVKSFKIELGQCLVPEKNKKAVAVLDADLNSFSPDVIIAFHDRCVQDYLSDYSSEKKTPVIVCMTHDSDNEDLYWGLSYTGILVMDMMPRLYKNLKPYTKGQNVTVLCCKHMPANTAALEDEYKNISVKRVDFSSYSDFMEVYRKVQDESDAVILAFSGLPKGWDPSAAHEFIMKNTKVPTGATWLTLAPYVMFVMAPSVSETAALVADSALKVLYGTAPSMIPPKNSSELIFTVNVTIAGAIGITIPVQVLKTAKVIR